MATVLQIVCHCHTWKKLCHQVSRIFLKADKDDVSGCLKMPPIYESVAEFQYYLEYICSQSHACNLLCIMPLLVQIIEVAAPVVVGAAVLAKCEILNCCNSLNSSWVSNLYNCNFF